MNNTNIFQERPWGWMNTYQISSGGNWWIKLLHINAGQRLSLQSHSGRSEHWTCVSGAITVELGDTVTELTQGMSISFGPGVVHRASSKDGGEFVEFAYGNVDESDITRYEDDYGRK